MSKIEKDKAVFIHYTLTDDEGEVLDSSEEAEPLGYLHGHGQIIPGLEKELEGHEVGDSFEVTIQAEEAYGLRNEDLVSTVPSSLFEGVDDVEVGMQFRAESDQGPQLVTVTEVEGEEVTIDANHPLAGEQLNFEVEVKDIRPATDEELQHGHVHTDGHSH
ncbi:MAG: peptidylprolyl isomerase [Anaerolineales bacterium]